MVNKIYDKLKKRKIIIGFRYKLGKYWNSLSEFFLFY